MDATQTNPSESPIESQIWNLGEYGQPPQVEVGQVAKPRRLPIHFLRNSQVGLENWPSTASAETDAFEALLAGMLTNSLNQPANLAQPEASARLGRLCGLLGVDRWSIWQRCGKSFDSLILTQTGAAPIDASCGAHETVEVQAPVNGTLENTTPVETPVGSESKTCFPWLNNQLLNGRRIVFSKLEELPPEAGQDKLALSKVGIRASAIWPLKEREEVLGAITFDQVGEERTWSVQVLRRLELIADVIASADSRRLIEDTLQTSQAEIRQLKERLQVESEFVKNDGKIAHLHGGIIGRSQAIKRVLHLAEQVAAAECAVLINGETGTGKELIAMEIHRLSRRKDHPMVLVNCAALPSALVESELFGREKGAYTGALTSQVGRFEVADRSTIFLDEVGELSLEVQAKLLRVLQQGEFQRLGSPKTHKVDVRVIAATNRDLAGEVRKGKFREDLYYRLKVFPIEIPPLRDRIEDIPLMVFAFLEEFSAQMGKKITKVPSKAMAVMQKHAWPGNIRELRNVIEHSVILSSGDILKLSFVGESPLREMQPVTLAEVERQHILRTLESTGWRIKGLHGAAVRLDLQPSTLYSRMQKLGIPHRRQKDEMSPGG